MEEKIVYTRRQGGLGGGDWCCYLWELKNSRLVAVLMLSLEGMGGGGGVEKRGEYS